MTIYLQGLQIVFTWIKKKKAKENNKINILQIRTVDKTHLFKWQTQQKSLYNEFNSK